MMDKCIKQRSVELIFFHLSFLLRDREFLLSFDLSMDYMKAKLMNKPQNKVAQCAKVQNLEVLHEIINLN